MQQPEGTETTVLFGALGKGTQEDDGEKDEQTVLLLVLLAT